MELILKNIYSLLQQMFGFIQKRKGVNYTSEIISQNATIKRIGGESQITFMINAEDLSVMDSAKINGITPINSSYPVISFGDSDLKLNQDFSVIFDNRAGKTKSICVVREIIID